MPGSDYGFGSPLFRENAQLEGQLAKLSVMCARLESQLHNAVANLEFCQSESASLKKEVASLKRRLAGYAPRPARKSDSARERPLIQTRTP